MSPRVDQLRRGDRCAPIVFAKETPAHLQPDDPLEAPPSVPHEVLRVARAAGLQTLVVDPEKPPPETLLVIVRLQSEVAAALSMADCLGDTAEDLQRELAERRSSRELSLTLASIGAGAVAAVAAGAIEINSPDSRVAPIVAIGGGIGAAGLGAGALLVPPPTVHLRHEPNVLRAVRSNGEDAPLPPFVWRLLNSPRADRQTPRDRLRKQWQTILDSFARTPEKRTDLELLLFGTGGEYDLEALSAREGMLDELETEIDLMNQDLDLLIQYLLRPDPP